MMDWTDRHCRVFHRLMSRRARLYTEMLTTGAVIHGDRARLLGFDASEHEPLGFLRVTEDGFARAGALIAASGLPAAIIQEGGYNVDLLGRLLERFIGGWNG